MKKLSTAILCISRNEQPYLSEWIEYHIKLGFDCIYLISTDDDFHKMVTFIENNKYKSKINLHHFSDLNKGWQIACYNKFFKLVKEDWLMVMDVDEYLNLNGCNNIEDLVLSMDDDTAQIQLPWLNITTSNFFNEHTFSGLTNGLANASDHVKSMIRVNMKFNMGIHRHDVRNLKTVLSSGDEVKANHMHKTFIRDKSYYGKNPFIMHFCSRGHFDVINRIIDHQFFNTKNGQNERNRLKNFLTKEPSLQNLPNRFFLMKFHQFLPKVEFPTPLPSLTAKTNTKALSTLFLNNIKDILTFDFSDHSTIENSFEEQFNLQEKLHALNFDDIFNIDEYFNSRSQLEYLSKLRHKFSNNS